MIKDLGILVLFVVLASVVLAIPYTALILLFKLTVVEASHIVFAIIALIFALIRIIGND